LGLRDLIRGKPVPDRFATATVATVATPAPDEDQPVASVATVAVAIPAKANPAIEVSDRADDTATVSPWWRFHYINREAREVMYSPPVNHAEALSGEPDAISAEPFVPAVEKPDEPLSMEEEGEIRVWLASIEETDEAMIAAVLGQCETDAKTRSAFLQRTADNNDKMRWSS
jgi:hypothetical protein